MVEVDIKEWNAETVRLTLNVARASEEVKQAIELLQIQTQALSDYAERIRLETRTDVDRCLEETLTVLYEAEQTNVGLLDGYDHYSIRNDHVNAERYAVAIEKKLRGLEETQQSFVSTILELLQKYNGKKLIVRRLPEYHLTEEGEHIFRCRLNFEKVN